jgi:hypothetical protein
MAEMKRFSFVVLQYRHDVWSGEAMNVAVLLSCPEAGFLQMRGRTSAGRRLTAAYPYSDRGGIGQALRDLANSVTKISKEVDAPLFDSELPAARQVADMLFPNSDAALGWGREGSGITADPDAELEYLVQRYVMQFDPDQPDHARTDEDVFLPVKSLLIESGVADKYTSANVRSDVYEVEFPYAYQNGILHVVKALSFDQTATEGVLDKASNWSGKLLNLRKSTQPFKPYLLLGHPSRPELHDAFDKAVKMLRRSAEVAELEAEIVDEEQFASLGDMLIDVVRKSDAQQLPS